jgi:hypothetical protein
MARKTFVSYKYSEARDLRDAIIDALGDDATYYQGETSESPDLTDTSTENIKRNLRDMIYDTSVTIVVISPHVNNSKWIDWEIEYSLKEITREDRTSRTNGLVGVIMKCNGGYDWIVSHSSYDDGCKPRLIDDSKLYPIIKNNRFNLHPPVYTCEHCKTVDSLSGSYISLIEEGEFLKDPSKYIENAYDKSTRLDDYKICKTR